MVFTFIILLALPDDFAVSSAAQEAAFEQLGGQDRLRERTGEWALAINALFFTAAGLAVVYVSLPGKWKLFLQSCVGGTLCAGLCPCSARVGDRDVNLGIAKGGVAGWSTSGSRNERHAAAKLARRVSSQPQLHLPEPAADVDQKSSVGPPSAGLASA